MAAPVLAHKLYVLEEGTLASLANNAAFVKEFPFLRSLAYVKKNLGCGSCGASSSQRSTSFQAAKQTIASLPAEKKRRLKELLNARQVRLVFIRGDGRTEVRTF